MNKILNKHLIDSKNNNILIYKNLILKQHGFHVNLFLKQFYFLYLSLFLSSFSIQAMLTKTESITHLITSADIEIIQGNFLTQIKDYIATNPILETEKIFYFEDPKSKLTFCLDITSFKTETHLINASLYTLNQKNDCNLIEKYQIYLPTCLDSKTKQQTSQLPPILSKVKNLNPIDIKLLSKTTELIYTSIAPQVFTYTSPLIDFFKRTIAKENNFYTDISKINFSEITGFNIIQEILSSKAKPLAVSENVYGKQFYKYQLNYDNKLSGYQNRWPKNQIIRNKDPFRHYSYEVAETVKRQELIDKIQKFQKEIDELTANRDAFVQKEIQKNLPKEKTKSTLLETLYLTDENVKTKKNDLAKERELLQYIKTSPKRLKYQLYYANHQKDKECSILKKEIELEALNKVTDQLKNSLKTVVPSVSKDYSQSSFNRILKDIEIATENLNNVKNKISSKAEDTLSIQKTITEDQAKLENIFWKLTRAIKITTKREDVEVRINQSKKVIDSNNSKISELLEKYFAVDQKIEALNLIKTQKKDIQAAQQTEVKIRQQEIIFSPAYKQSLEKIISDPNVSEDLRSAIIQTIENQGTVQRTEFALSLQVKNMLQNSGYKLEDYKTFVGNRTQEYIHEQTLVSLQKAATLSKTNTAEFNSLIDSTVDLAAAAVELNSKQQLELALSANKAANSIITFVETATDLGVAAVEGAFQGVKNIAKTGQDLIHAVTFPEEVLPEIKNALIGSLTNAARDTVIFLAELRRDVKYFGILETAAKRQEGRYRTLQKDSLEFEKLLADTTLHDAVKKVSEFMTEGYLNGIVLGELFNSAKNIKAEIELLKTLEKEITASKVIDLIEIDGVWQTVDSSLQRGSVEITQTPKSAPMSQEVSKLLDGIILNDLRKITSIEGGKYSTMPIKISDGAEIVGIYDWEHIIKPIIDKNGEFSGCHFDPGKKLENHIQIITTHELAGGHYHTKIIINGFEKTSTFFNHNLTHEQIYEMTQESLCNLIENVKLSKNKQDWIFLGRAKDGTPIKTYCNIKTKKMHSFPDFLTFIKDKTR